MGMKTIAWPDLRFPPINLWNAPLQRCVQEVIKPDLAPKVRVTAGQRGATRPHLTLSRILSGR